MRIFPSQFSRDDQNPSIRLFGRRFSNDLQTMNVLAELLLVASADKRIGADGEPFAAYFSEGHELSLLREGRSSVSYSPKARLNLKLFLSSTRPVCQLDIQYIANTPENSGGAFPARSI